MNYTGHSSPQGPYPGMMAYTYREHIQDFAASGIEVFRLSLPLGWVGPDRYDYTEGDETVAAFCAAGPDIRLFPLLWLDGPESKWWELVYPDEVAVAIDRRTGSVRRTHPAVPAPAQPGRSGLAEGDLFDRHHQGAPCLHSFASDIWRTGVMEALRRAITHYESAFPGRFTGYYLCGGLSYEWFNWGNYTDEVLFDYSEPMKRHFRRWLERRYGTTSACAAAWRRPACPFAGIEPPPPAERPARDAYPLLIPAQQTPAADFALALADAQSDVFLEACRTARSCAAPDARIGGLFGYWWTQTDHPGPARSGHLALQRVLESPDVDFLGSPYDYTNRGVGGVNTSQGMPGSIRRHGKAYINSTDIKLAEDRHGWQPFIRVPRTEEEAVELMKRDFAFSMGEGQEQSWVDLFGGAFRHPALRDTLARLHHIARLHTDARVPPREECLVVVDEESLRWTTPNTPMTVPLFGVQKQWNLLRSGFPWSFITLSDYLALDFPDARLVYFVNLFRADADLDRRLHERLRASSCTAIWTLWPGALADDGFDVRGVERRTGFLTRQTAAAEGDWTARMRDEPGVVPAGLRYGTGVSRACYSARMKHYPPAEAFTLSPRLAIIPQAGDACYADWTDGAGVALGRHDRLGFRSVLNACPLLPAAVLGCLAADAGAHVYASPGDLVYANDRFLAIYTGEPGPRTIRLCRPARVMDLWSGIPVNGAPVDGFTIEAAAGKTYLYKLEALA